MPLLTRLIFKCPFAPNRRAYGVAVSVDGREICASAALDRLTALRFDFLRSLASPEYQFLSPAHSASPCSKFVGGRERPPS